MRPLKKNEIPESNGWPDQLPLRPWVPALQSYEIRPDDWVRHPRISSNPVKFWHVRNVLWDSMYTTLFFHTQPQIRADQQPYRITVPRYDLVEVRLMWPADVTPPPPLGRLEIKAAPTPAVSARRRGVLDWWAHHHRQET